MLFLQNCVGPSAVNHQTLLIGKRQQPRQAPACVAVPRVVTNLSLCFQTLGHLEKAVVLELTLKHVKALTNLIEQQQQKIIALQNGLQAGEYSNRVV